MIILGEKYIFNDIEKNRLKKRFKKIKKVPYKDIDTKKTIENIEILLSKEDHPIIVLNTKAKVDDELLKYLTNLELKGIEFITIEHFLEKYLHKCYIPEDNSDISFLEDIKPYNSLQYLQKRAIDFFIGVPLFILALPIMIYSAYRIKKESPQGSIIFKQKRVGKGGKEFICYKFRSMIPDAEKEKPQFASKDDPRVFKWGAFMRKTRIDELPQLLNVFKGEMHLIGPRPERKYWVDQFEETIPYYNERHLVAPGITGWAQVNYPYGSNTEDARQKLMYDLYYIKNWSLWLEIKTIFKTIWVMVGGKGL